MGSEMCIRDRPEPEPEPEPEIPLPSFASLRRRHLGQSEPEELPETVASCDQFSDADEITQDVTELKDTDAAPDLDIPPDTFEIEASEELAAELPEESLEVSEPLSDFEFASDVDSEILTTGVDDEVPVQLMEAETTEPEAVEIPLAEAQPAPIDLAPAPRKLRVLAAEDNKTNQLVFRKMLKDLELDLIFAVNGEDAVALYKELNPDMIFMDISMPIMDGREATIEIRKIEVETGEHVPIIAMTAHTLSGDETEILASGIDHYLTKPLRKPLIHQKIAELAPQDVVPPIPVQIQDLAS